MLDINNIRAVFFDLDGTLMDSESLTEQAVTQLLNERGITSNALNLKQFHGITWQKIGQILQSHFPELVPSDTEAYLGECATQLALSSPPPLLPGARDAFLRASQLLPVAIVTGSESAIVQSFLSRFDLIDACSFYISCDQYTFSKPHPQSYLMAAEKLGYPPSSCLVFEDSLPGLQAAKKAGMPAIAIHHNAPAPAAGLARAYIADYTLLPSDFFHRIHHSPQIQENCMALDNPVLHAALNSISLEKIKEEMGPPPWSHPVVRADHVAGVVIYQNSGQENDRHCHTYDEWWIVLEGEIDWVIEGRENEPVQAKAGDFIFVPAQTFHQIFPKGDGPSVRLGISLPGHGHLHEKPAQRAKVTIE